MADNEITKRTRAPLPPLDVEGALDRMTKPAPESAWAKLHPSRWPVGVRAGVIATITAALVSAKVPAAVASAIAAWLLGQ